MLKYCKKCRDKSFLIECSCGCGRIKTRANRWGQVTPDRLQGHRPNRSSWNKLPIPTKNELYNLYINEFMSLRELAKHYDTDSKVVWRWLKLYDIRTRPISCYPGQYSSNWKGGISEMELVHRRLYKIYGRIQKCSVCNTDDSDKWYHWANLTGNYRDYNDYKRMCAKCHREYDGERRKYSKVKSFEYLLPDCGCTSL